MMYMIINRDVYVMREMRRHRWCLCFARGAASPRARKTASMAKFYVAAAASEECCYVLPFVMLFQLMLCPDSASMICRCAPSGAPSEEVAVSSSVPALIQRPSAIAQRHAGAIGNRRSQRPRATATFSAQPCLYNASRLRTLSVVSTEGALYVRVLRAGAQEYGARGGAASQYETRPTAHALLTS